jgi:hypothetical protein
MIPKRPFTVHGVRTGDGPAQWICDANDLVICQAPDEAMAHFVADKLNMEPRRNTRSLAAMEIGDFRMHLERDNGGPLTGDPSVALLLDNLCDFLQFGEGERALALGADLLVYLAQMDNAPAMVVA